MAIDFAPAWRRHVAAHARDAVMPLRARILSETPKALLLDTGLRRAWVPKSQVKEGTEAGVYMVPMWLCNRNLLV